MRNMTLTIAPDALDRDGISVSQKPTEAGNLSITGALTASSVATMDIARHVAIYSSANDSARTFIVTGTDRDSKALTETITGPNATTVKGDKNFLTVTQIAVDAATAGNIEVGTTNELESQWIPLDIHARETSYSVDLSAETLNYEVEYTLDDVFDSAFDEHTAEAFGYGIEGTTLDGKFDKVVTATRLKITSFSSGTAVMRILTAHI